MTSYRSELEKHLLPAALRLRRRRTAGLIPIALQSAGLVVLCIAVWRLGEALTGRPVGFSLLSVTTIAALAVPAAALAVAWMLGRSQRLDWLEAARAVDRHFGLQDRVTTALALAEEAGRRPMIELECRDALGRLQAHAAAEAVTLRRPRGLIRGLLLVAVAVTAALVPIPSTLPDRITASWESAVAPPASTPGESENRTVADPWRLPQRLGSGTASIRVARPIPDEPANQTDDSSLVDGYFDRLPAASEPETAPPEERP